MILNLRQLECHRRFIQKLTAESRWRSTKHSRINSLARIRTELHCEGGSPVRVGTRVTPRQFCPSFATELSRQPFLKKFRGRNFEKDDSNLNIAAFVLRQFPRLRGLR
jgi:uncharacterized protein (DUF433 family)